MRIIFLGPPGVGKGTQAIMLAEKLKVPHIATGDILREEMKSKSSVGDTSKMYVLQGGLVPDSVVIDIVRSRLEMDDCKNGFVLDGFPRTIPQANALEKMLHEWGVEIDVVIYLNCPQKVIVARISGRRVCNKCGAVYHMKTMPPKKPGICDKCDPIQLTHRADDNEEVVIERLSAYKKATAPLIEYYNIRNILKEVSADGTPQEIMANIGKAVWPQS